MPVISYAYLDSSGQVVPATYSHETHAMIDIIKRLWSAFHDRDEVYAVVCNLHNDNRPAADLAIITEFGLGVVELKNHPGRIRLQGDTWFAGAIPIKGGSSYSNPYQQVQAYARDVRDRLLFLKSDWLQHQINKGAYAKIQTAVCFTHPDSQVEDFRREFRPALGEQVLWERFSIIQPGEVVEWAASLRFEVSQRLSRGEGFRTASLTWDEIEHFATGYLDASQWTEIANLMPSDEPYGVLILKEQQQRQAVFTLDRDEVIIGRNPLECNLVIPDQYTLVSKLHARIQRIGRQVWLSDLGSTNGTYLSGRWVTQSQLLEFGQKIRLGSWSDSSRTCALEFQPPDYVFVGPTDRGSGFLTAS